MTKYTIYFSQSAEHPFYHFCEAYARGSAAIAMHALRRDYPCVTVEIKNDTGYVYRFTDGKYEFHKWRR